MSEEQLPLPVFLTTWAFDPPKSQIKPADIIPSQRARRGSSLSHLPILLVTVTFIAGTLGRVLPDPRSAQLLLRGPSSETRPNPGHLGPFPLRQPVQTSALTQFVTMSYLDAVTH